MSRLPPGKQKSGPTRATVYSGCCFKTRAPLLGQKCIAAFTMPASESQLIAHNWYNRGAAVKRRTPGRFADVLSILGRIL